MTQTGTPQSGWLQPVSGKLNVLLAPAAAEANRLALRGQRRQKLFAQLSLRENIICNDGTPGKLPALLQSLEITTFNGKTLVGRMGDYDRLLAKMLLALCGDTDTVALPLAGTAIPESLQLKLISALEQLTAEGKTAIFTATDPQIARSRAQVYHLVLGDKVLNSGNCSDGDLAGEFDNACTAHQPELFPSQPRKSGAMVMEVLGLQLPGYKGDISLNARKGEILGIYGLGECGMDKMYRSLTARMNADKGVISLNKNNLKARTMNPGETIAAGTGILPRDDFSGALSASEDMSVAVLQNVSTLGITRAGKMEKKAEDSAEALQKLLENIPEELQPDKEFAHFLRRLLATDFEAFIFRNCDSTYKYVPLLRHVAGAIAQSGKAVIWFTSDLQEIFNLCDMTAVLHNGTLCPPRQTSKWTPQEVTGYANSATAGAFSIL